MDKRRLEKLYNSILQNRIRKNKYKNSKNKKLEEKTIGSIFRVVQYCPL